MTSAAPARTKPWHTTVTCKHCKTPTVIPARERNRAEEIPREHNLACGACGRSWKGSAEDVAHAESASASWEENEKRAALLWLPAWMVEAALVTNFGRGSEIVLRVGGRNWFSNGAVALRDRASSPKRTRTALSHQETILASLLVIRPKRCASISARATHGDGAHHAVKLGRVWLDAQWVTLVETLYPGVSWYAGGAHDPVHAVVAETEALVMGLKSVDRGSVRPVGRAEVAQP